MLSEAFCKEEDNMKLGIGLVVLYIFALILVSMPVAAVFEVPEGATIFESLGLSETYDCNTSKCQTKEVILQFAEPSEIKIVLYTFRSEWMFNARIYVNGLLATAKVIKSGNQETTMTIPGAFIETGENTIYLEFISYNEYYKFSKFPITIAPKSYILSTNGHIPPLTPTPTPTPTSAQMDTPGFYIVNTQKSSETAPEINIEPINKQKLSNTTVFLSGSASSDSGIKSVTVNGQYAGTENWALPVDLSLGDGNIVIIATGNDDNTTIQNISLKSPSSDNSNNNIIIIGAFIGAIGSIVGAIITIFYNKKKEKKKTKKQSLNYKLTPEEKNDQNDEDRNKDSASFKE